MTLDLCYFLASAFSPSRRTSHPWRRYNLERPIRVLASGTLDRPWSALLTTNVSVRVLATALGTSQIFTCLNSEINTVG